MKKLNSPPSPVEKQQKSIIQLIFVCQTIHCSHSLCTFPDRFSSGRIKKTHRLSGARGNVGVLTELLRWVDIFHFVSIDVDQDSLGSAIRQTRVQAGH